MDLPRRARAALERLAEGRRRVWSGPHRSEAQRTWIELRTLPAGEEQRLARLVEARLEVLDGVEWARLNPYFGRLVVQHQPGYPTRAELVAEVVAAERALGIGERPFAGQPRHHPGDGAPLRRTVLKTAGNVGSLALSGVLRASEVEAGPGHIDLAALSNALENMPQTRRWLDDRLGGSTADLLLTLTSSASQGVAQGVVGQAVDLVGRGLRIREIRAARAAWRQREPELAGRPEDHEVGAGRVTPRPGHMPDGPIERYSEKAAAASLGGFSFSVASSGQAEQATASIFGVAPKPARVGREAFAASLGQRLAQRGFVVPDNRPLRRLDRIDTLVIAHEVLAPTEGSLSEVVALGARKPAEVERQAQRLFDPSQPGAVAERSGWSLGPLPALGVGIDSDTAERIASLESRGRTVLGLVRRRRLAALVAVQPVMRPAVREVVARARQAGLRVLPATDHPEHLRWLHSDRVVRAGAHAAADLRRLQAEGRGVAYIGAGPVEALEAADLGVGHPCPPAPAPWGADLFTLGTDDDLACLLNCLLAARTASQQSVYVSMAEAAAGLTLTMGDQELPAVRRVMAIGGLSSLVAMANGVRVAARIDTRRRADRAPVPWHALEPEEALLRAESRREGLEPDEAAARRLPDPPPPGRPRRFARAVWLELANPFAPILATGAGLSALIGAPGDAALVAAALGVSGVVGGVQRYQTEQALLALSRAQPTRSRVLRAGHLAEVLSEEVVVGDVIHLSAGDRVPADCRVLEAEGLEVDESSLTGESLPVPKGPEPSFAAAVADRSSMLHAETVVAAGSAWALVVAIGEQTEARRPHRSGEGPPPTGVETRLQSLTELTAPVAGLTALAVMASGLVRQRPPEELVGSAVNLSVAAVPEGLPLLATVAQLSAARRLSALGALVRNPRAVEALGRVDVVCADKTGTLTEGRIRLLEVSDGDTSHPLSDLPARHRKVLAIALRASPPGDAEQQAHPTDQAVIAGGAAAGVGPTAGREWERRRELPFEPGRGFHAALGRVGGTLRLSVKGAPETVLPRCNRRAGSEEGQRAPLSDEEREALLLRAFELAARGLRVLAVAERGARDDMPIDERRVKNLVFRGFLALADPPRATARQAVAQLQAAGIDVVMITGDHPSTARAIAAELGISDPDGPVVTGPELELLPPAELDARVQRARVFARVTPQLKVRIVQALQRAGRTVAMTGDGANDAPAIRLADVGIALGTRSTAAARGAADVVVTDERIETIVAAVLEGRALWASVRDAVSILVGGNLGEIGFTLLGGLIDGSSPLNTRQIMMVNLFTDALPALTIALRPPETAHPEQLLEEGPDQSLGSALNRDIAWRAAVTSGATAAAWGAARLTGSPEQARSVAFLTLVGSQLGQTLLAGRRSPQVVLPSLASFAALVTINQVPALSRGIGSQPAGPIGLVQAGTAIAGATAVAAAAPPLARWLQARARRSDLARRALASQPARLVTESRLLLRLREGVPRAASEPDPVD